MNQYVAITFALLAALVALVSASGYGMGGGYGGQSYGGQSYGQNYDRKTGFKTTIYHPYGGVSNRFDYRTYPAYGGYGSGYGNNYPAPYIRSGLEYTIQDQGYGAPSYGGSSY